MEEQQFGIIDLGSNSVRLVLYRREETDTIQEIDNLKSVLRLSAHINEKGEVSKKGIEKLIDCLNRYSHFCQARSVTKIYGIATAAIRGATNRDQVVSYIKKETGLEFRVLKGEEEAYYGYLAVVNTLDYSEAITVDIGGGSTEVTYYKGRVLLHSYSFPFGAVTLSKTFGEDIDRIRSFVMDQLKTQSWIAGKQCPIIVMGGTARNLARIHQRKRNYSLSSLHNYVMEREDVDAILQDFRMMSMEERKEVDGLSRDRADIFPMGLSVFLAIMDTVQSPHLITSNKGLRDGFLYKMLYPNQKGILPDILEHSTLQFMKRYRVHTIHAEHVAGIAVQLFDSSKQAGGMEWGERERELLRTAALLQDIGRSINVIESTKHTFYLIENVLLLGVTHRERIMIGLIASYKNNRQLMRLASVHRTLLSKEDEKLSIQLGTMVSLAKILDRYMDQRIQQVRIHTGKKKLMLELDGQDIEWIKESLDDGLKKLGKALGHTISLKG